MKGISSMHQVLSFGTLVMNILCVLLTLNLLSGNFGITSPSLLHLSSVFLLLGVTLLNLPLRTSIQMLRKKPSGLFQLYFGLILLIVAFLILLFTDVQLLWLASVPLLISGLSLCLQTMERSRKELYWLTVTSYGYAVVFLLLQTMPFLWSMYQQSSRTLTNALGKVIGTPLLLGPTTSGFTILLIFLVFLLCIFILLEKKTRTDVKRFALAVTGMVLVWVVYIMVLGSISYSSKSDTITFHPVLFLLGLLPVFWYLISIKTSDIKTEDAPQILPRKKLLKSGYTLIAVLLFLSTTVLTVFVIGDASTVDHHKILFYSDHMLGTWDVPEYGKYGKDAVGMFGLLPVYLTTLGYQSELLVENRTAFLESFQNQNPNITRYLNLTDYMTIIESQEITNNLFDDADVFVVTNLNISFSAAEHAVIWDFIRNGGSLLVLGDHTDVGGIQTPLNDLLSPVGVRYRFDAALPLDDTFKWLTCTHLFPHPITTPLPGLDTLQYGVGASLDIPLSSFPVITGTYALSDEGNRTNEDIAFLGDYEYVKGETLGDVILVAGAYYGRGKVLVFGDTSSFQNAALTFSFPFIQNIFTWLTSTQTGVLTAAQIVVSLTLLITAMLFFYLRRPPSMNFSIFPILLCASLLFTSSLNTLLITNTEVMVSSPIVSIDASHGERFTLESFTDDSINGLLVNLQRNNFLPILEKKFPADHLSARKILFFIAPTRTFTADEVVLLEKYMINGGYIVLATGYDDKQASLPLLQTCGVDVEQTPLGPVPYGESNTTLYQNEPRFVDSWPLTAPQNQTVSYYNFSWEDFTFDLVIFVQQGLGGLLVIGDSQFLLDKNIESIYDYWPGNILFLKYLIDELHAQPMEDES
jgi:hypothetical protein